MEYINEKVFKDFSSDEKLKDFLLPNLNDDADLHRKIDEDNKFTRKNVVKLDLDNDTSVRKMIVIDDCLHCPNWMECEPSKKLTSQQRLSLMIGIGRAKFILIGCPLDDVPKIN